MKDAGVDDRPPDDANRLCLSCGMCCDSTLFLHGSIRNDEQADARANGFTVAAIGDALKFPQPCHCLDGMACTAYRTWRPQVCSRFRCAVLTRMESGEIDVDVAMDRVAKAKELLTRLPGELRTRREMQQFADRAQTKMRDGMLDRNDALRITTIIATMRYLDSEFRTAGMTVLSSDDSV